MFFSTTHSGVEHGCGIDAGVIVDGDGATPWATVEDTGPSIGHAVEVLATLGHDTGVELRGELGMVDMDTMDAGVLVEWLDMLAVCEPGRVLDADTLGVALGVVMQEEDMRLGVRP